MACGNQKRPSSYKEELIINTFKLNRTFLYLSGLVPSDAIVAVPWKLGLYRVYTFFTLFIISTGIIATFVSIFEHWQDVERAGESAFVCISFVLVFLGSIYILLYWDELQKLMRTAEHEILSNIQKTYVKHLHEAERFSRFLTRFLFISCLSVAVTRSYVPLIIHYVRKYVYGAGGTNRHTLTLLFDMWFPFHIDNTPLFLLAYIIQMLIQCISVAHNVSVITYFFTLFIYSCTRFKILQAALKSIDKFIPEYEEYDHKLSSELIQTDNCEFSDSSKTVNASSISEYNLIEEKTLSDIRFANVENEELNDSPGYDVTFPGYYYERDFTHGRSSKMSEEIRNTNSKSSCSKSSEVPRPNLKDAGYNIPGMSAQYPNQVIQSENSIYTVSIDVYCKNKNAENITEHIELEVVETKRTSVTVIDKRIVHEEDMDSSTFVEEEMSVPNDKEPQNRKAERYFIECIREHQDVISFVDNLNNIISTWTFLYSWLEHCTVYYSILYLVESMENMKFFLRALFGLIGELIRVYILCFFGENIIHKSLEIHEALYECRWYNCCPKLKRLFHISMMRAQKPSVLKTGKWGFLSNETFSELITNAYICFILILELRISNHHIS
ncbi:Odorant receptor 56 [Blattella germanica]|nr:Odorant receptor 56 [Blattella germanica]